MKSLFGLAAILLVIASVATAATLNVPSQYATIQAAVDAANPGDVVQVAAGTYSDVTHMVVEGIDTTYCAVIMKSGITVKGSGTTQTFLNADSLGRGFHCSGVTNSTIRDLTIRRAFANVHGAAIFCNNGSSPAIYNCNITDCYDGGIICIVGSSPTIQNCTLQNCKSKSGGGLMIEDNCSPQVSRTTIINNRAPSGGGVFIRNASSPVLTDCTIQGNSIDAANGGGGGLAVVTATATLNNCKILDNTSDGFGGGISLVDSAFLTMTDCIVQGNETVADMANGGGIYAEFSDMSLEDCVIARNSVLGVDSDGSALFFSFVFASTLHQCTIAANTFAVTPTTYGVIGCFLASPTIQQSIIAFNDPGVVFNLDGSSAPTVSCTDIYGNPGGVGTGWTDGGYNFYLDPLFCDLANNNFRIQVNSPCAGGKHPAGAWSCGNTRIGALDPGCNPASADDSPYGPVGRFLEVHPNPFGNRATIDFEVPNEGNVSVAVYDASGRLVRELRGGVVGSGIHSAEWDGTDNQGNLSPSGVYFCKVRSAGLERTVQMVIAR